MYTHFADHLAKKDSAIYDVVKLDPDLHNYRDRVQRFIREHQDHVTIQRLKNNEADHADRHYRAGSHSGCREWSDSQRRIGNPPKN